jgi:hypothetical protein
VYRLINSVVYLEVGQMKYVVNCLAKHANKSVFEEGEQSEAESLRADLISMYGDAFVDENGIENNFEVETMSDEELFWSMQLS